MAHIALPSVALSFFVVLPVFLTFAYSGTNVQATEAHAHISGRIPFVLTEALAHMVPHRDTSILGCSSK